MPGVMDEGKQHLLSGDDDIRNEVISSFQASRQNLFTPAEAAGDSIRET